MIEEGDQLVETMVDSTLIGSFSVASRGRLLQNGETMPARPAVPESVLGDDAEP